MNQDAHWLLDNGSPMTTPAFTIPKLLAQKRRKKEETKKRNNKTTSTVFPFDTSRIRSPRLILCDEFVEEEKKQKSKRKQREAKENKRKIRTQK
jgi:hypothetical protein